MKGNNFKLYMVMAVLLIATVLAASTVMSAEKPKHWPKTIAIASGTGTTYYAIAGGIGKMMEKYLGVAGIPTKTSGGIETARLMAKGDLQFGFLTPDCAYEASWAYCASKIQVQRLSESSCRISPCTTTWSPWRAQG